jgi:hypothetical protein
MTRIGAVSIGLVLLLSMPVSLEAQTQPAIGGPEGFVQEFLDWYVIQDGWRAVLQQRRFAVHPDLRALLQAEAAAEESADGGLGGLDFDPFLASQDPCDRYRAGTVSRRGGRYLVEISGTCPSSGGMTDAVMELESSDSSWVIVNVHYPALGTDLWSRLRQSEDARQ